VLVRSGKWLSMATIPAPKPPNTCNQGRYPSTLYGSARRDRKPAVLVRAALPPAGAGVMDLCLVPSSPG